MKKKLLILATVFLTAMSFSTPKDDYVKALENFKKTNNDKIFKEDLNKILNAKDIEKGLKIELYQNLYYLEKDMNKKISYLDTLIKLEPNQLNYKLLLVVDYKLNKNEAKSKERYNNFTKNLKENDRETFDVLLARLSLNANLKNEALNIANKLLKSKNKLVQAEANKILAIINLTDKNETKALSYLETANTLSQSKDSETLALLANIYSKTKKYDKALDISLKLARNTKTGEFYPETILLAEILNKNVNEIYMEYKNTLKNDQKELINLDLATRYISSGYMDLGIKYAQKALKENNKKEANYLLAVAYANKNDKTQALKYVNEAKKFKIPGIDQLEKEINSKIK